MLLIFMGMTFIYVRYRKRIFKAETNKQIEIFKAAIEAEESTKERLANNIHDEVLALNSAVISALDNSISEYNNSELKIDGLENIKAISVQLNESLKTVSRELMPKVLTEIGFVQALGKHLKHLNNSNRSVFLKNTSPFDSELPFEKKEEVHIYRICLEILNNLCKHDKFTFLEVSLSTQENKLVINFRHDGKGISEEKISELSSSVKGFGLNSINSRLLILGASINYSVFNSGPEIEIKIPISI